TRFSRDWSSDVCSSDLQNGDKQDEDDQGSSPGLAQRRASPLPHRNRSSFQWIAIWPPRSSVTAAAHKLTQISCTFCTGTGQMVPSHAQLGLRLALAEPDGAVP